jgi:hypothetical protein
VHVVQHAIDFFHVYLLRAGVKRLGALWDGWRKTEIARAYGREKLGSRAGRPVRECFGEKPE